MTRAANMQALTNDVKRRWPGVVVYGIGDTAHKARPSGHNEDDTSGSKPELEDSDNRPEHRAIDIMIGSKFTKADADGLVARLLADPKARARLFYIIWNGHQWSRSSGWVKRTRTSDPHRDHVHISGWAADDENTATWPAVAKTPVASVEDDMSETAEHQIEQVYNGLFLGGTSMGLKVDPDGSGREVATNSLVGKLDYIVRTLNAVQSEISGDQQPIVRGVLEGLTPEKIAAAIPPTMAKQVADELARRLVGTTPQG